MTLLVIDLTIKGYGQEFAPWELPPLFHCVDFYVVEVCEGAECLDCGHVSICVLPQRVVVIILALWGVIFIIPKEEVKDGWLAIRKVSRRRVALQGGHCGILLQSSGCWVCRRWYCRGSSDVVEKCLEAGVVGVIRGFRATCWGRRRGGGAFFQRWWKGEWQRGRL
jgi:hypothetical protein